MATGKTTNSRLNELRKYVTTGGLLDRYVHSTGNGNGVNVSTSQVTNYPLIINYYIGDITYTDVIQSDGSSVTYFEFTPEGTSSPNFIDVPIIKNSDKDKIIGNPKIIDDVFIERDSRSAFDKNYRLQYLKSLNEILTYAGGGFFNIVNNT